MEIQKPDESNRSAYMKEVQKGLQIFEQGLNGMKFSQFTQQKNQYEKSTHESLQAIQDAVKGIMNKELNRLKDELSKDYQNYLDNPNDQNFKKVQSDIDSLKKSSQPQ